MELAPVRVFSCKQPLKFGLPYLLIELFYIGIPVVRTNGRAVGVRSRDNQIFSNGFGWVVYHIFLPMVLRFARESSAVREFKIRSLRTTLEITIENNLMQGATRYSPR